MNMSTIRTLLARSLGIGMVFLGVSGAVYGSMEKALVNRTLNEVFIHDNADPQGDFREARAGKDHVEGEQILRTGMRSRAELIFGDDSIARIGSNAVFTFVPEQREMFLGRGLMLYQAPKNSGPTRVSTSTVTASITGTTILVEVGEKTTKIILLEGAMQVSIPERWGEYIELKPGQMLIFPNDSSRLPEPVDIDISALVQSSEIISSFLEQETEEDPAGEKLRELNLVMVDQEAELQKIRLKEGKMELTDLAILGKGTTLYYLIDEDKSWLLERLKDKEGAQDRKELVEINRDARGGQNENEEGSVVPPGEITIPWTPISPAPNPDPDPNPRPVDPIVVKRPPLIDNPNPFILGGNAIINTNPSIVVADVAYSGAKYTTEAGTLSMFLFAETSASDTFFGVDGWANDGSSSWYRFSTLEMTGDPAAVNVLSGIERIGFISEGVLTVGAGSYSFSPLAGLTLVGNEGLRLISGTHFVNTGLDLKLYNRSNSQALEIGSSAIKVSTLGIYSAGDILIEDGASVGAIDSLEIKTENDVTLGTLTGMGADGVALFGNEVVVDSGSLNVGVGSWFYKEDPGAPMSGFSLSSAQGGSESSLLVRTTGDAVFAGQGTQSLNFDLSKFDIGGDFYAQQSDIQGLTHLFVGGNAEISSLRASTITVQGNVMASGDTYGDLINIGNNYQGQGQFSGHDAVVQGDLLASTVEVGKRLMVFGDLDAGQLVAREYYNSITEDQGNGGNEGELVDLQPPISSRVLVDGSINLRSSQGSGIDWVSNASLVLIAPSVVFNSSESASGGAIAGVNVMKATEAGGVFEVNARESLVVRNTEILATGNGGEGGQLQLLSDGYVQIASEALIQASNEQNTFGGEIKIRAGNNHPGLQYAIRVASSSQILALAQNSSIVLEALKGNIRMSGELNASQLEIVAREAGALIELNYQANIMADTVKVGALGEGGRLLIGSQGHNMTNFTGSELIRLYGGMTNGTVQFLGNTTLTSDKVQIAADKVIVNQGVYVEISGQNHAKVYANEHLYGVSGQGDFTGKGAVSRPLTEAPPY